MNVTYRLEHGTIKEDQAEEGEESIKKTENITPTQILTVKKANAMIQTSLEDEEDSVRRSYISKNSRKTKPTKGIQTTSKRKTKNDWFLRETTNSDQDSSIGRYQYDKKQDVNIGPFTPISPIKALRSPRTRKMKGKNSPNRKIIKLAEPTSPDYPVEKDIASESDRTVMNMIAN